MVAGFDVIFWVAEAITNLGNIWTAVTPIMVAFFIEIDEVTFSIIDLLILTSQITKLFSRLETHLKTNQSRFALPNFTITSIKGTNEI